MCRDDMSVEDSLCMYEQLEMSSSAWHQQCTYLSVVDYLPNDFYTCLTFWLPTNKFDFWGAPKSCACTCVGFGWSMINVDPLRRKRRQCYGTSTTCASHCVVIGDLWRQC
uniref:Uncharacterized protein n=1 Tax=Lotharella globosa TaxID=91324 RepID=A0A7S3Z8D4_9EUKA|mmetsp:Transcript_13215/g.25067  ORF Transcript_13215/g.25067 Transcript_13215/m.25067 type:complete len:110 (+) Transcript_13215:95-424(+)